MLRHFIISSVSHVILLGLLFFKNGIDDLEKVESFYHENMVVHMIPLIESTLPQGNLASESREVHQGESIAHTAGENAAATAGTRPIARAFATQAGSPLPLALPSVALHHIRSPRDTVGLLPRSCYRLPFRCSSLGLFHELRSSQRHGE